MTREQVYATISDCTGTLEFWKRVRHFHLTGIHKYVAIDGTLIKQEEGVDKPPLKKYEREFLAELQRRYLRKAKKQVKKTGL
jgi:hypothetical protein